MIAEKDLWTTMLVSIYGYNSVPYLQVVNPYTAFSLACTYQSNNLVLAHELVTFIFCVDWVRMEKDESKSPLQMCLSDYNIII